MEDAEHLQWLHDRIVNVYNEDRNVDFLVRMRQTIKNMEEQEKAFKAYVDFISNQS
jgi:hypothetical protein